MTMERKEYNSFLGWGTQLCGNENISDFLKRTFDEHSLVNIWFLVKWSLLNTDP